MKIETIYRAKDDTVFTNERECKRYEYRCEYIEKILKLFPVLNESQAIAILNNAGKLNKILLNYALDVTE